MNTHPIEHYRSLLFFGLGCILTSGIIFWEWHFIANEYHPSVSAYHEAQENHLNRLSDDKEAMMPLQKYQEMVNAPLFFEGREEVATITANNDDGSLKLTGIILAPQGFLALIRDEKSTYYRLDKGNDVQGWTVANVQKDRVELVRNSESRELMLFEANANTHDLTAKELEDCFKNHADRPLKDCVDHPGKPTHKNE
ncbi:MAG: hypothetical protein NTV00_07375 [Methylococcales bacterium]|nr:hypothetical protein [Methylococcales bacterium]